MFYFDIRNETKYCFGLSVKGAQTSLKLAQFTGKGFHSIQTMGGTNRGIPWILKNGNQLSLFARYDNNTLYRVTIANDEVLQPNIIPGVVNGDPNCYIDETTAAHQLYCFVRNDAYGLAEYVETSTNDWHITQLTSENDRIRDDIAPTCSYVGASLKYCFVILENGYLSRIVSKSGIWLPWKTMGHTQFRAMPVLFTSQSINYTGTHQICYLLAIDNSQHLQLSINPECNQDDNFTDWTPLFESVQVKQFNKVFRLRNDDIGILGIDVNDRPCFTIFDRVKNEFTAIRTALTMKSEQFQP